MSNNIALEWYFIDKNTYKEGLNSNKIQDGFLYFLYDTKELYRGKDLFNAAFELYDTEKPANPASKRIYINKNTLEGSVYTNGTWHTVINPVSSTIYPDNETLPVNSKAVVEYITDQIARHNIDIFSHKDVFDTKSNRAYNFMVTLTADGWLNGLQTIVNEAFHLEGYTYIMEYDTDKTITCLDMDTDGQATFKRIQTLTEDVVVNILRIETGDGIQKPGVISLSSSEVILNANNTSIEIEVKRFGTGEITVTSTDESVATVVLNEDETITITGIGIGDCTINISVSETDDYTAVETTIAVSSNVYNIYGVEWDGTSTTVWSRTDNSSDFTNPVPYVAGATEYGSPFDNIYPWSGMVRVTDEVAGELVAIPKFYYKWTKNGDTLKLQISDKPLSGFHTSPAHVDCGDGYGERDIIYVGRYLCDSNYQSTTGIAPKKRAYNDWINGIQSAYNEDTQYCPYTYAVHVTIQMLYLVEFAEWDIYKVIGQTQNQSLATEVGVTDGLYHTGTSVEDRSTKGIIQYRYIEGLCCSKYWIHGFYYRGWYFYAHNDPHNASTSEGTNIGSIQNFASGTGVSYVKNFDIVEIEGFEWVLIPNSEGTKDAYTTDAWVHQNISETMASIHGYNSTDTGLFYISVQQLSLTATNRIVKLPNNNT